MFSEFSARRGEILENARRIDREKEIRQKKRGDARWMRFHRGRHDGLCSSQEGVGGSAERKHTEDASSNVGGVEEGASDAGRAVATPGVR